LGQKSREAKSRSGVPAGRSGRAGLVLLLPERFEERRIGRPPGAVPCLHVFPDEFLQVVLGRTLLECLHLHIVPGIDAVQDKRYLLHLGPTFSGGREMILIGPSGICINITHVLHVTSGP
jgi:hypothetical protein